MILADLSKRKQQKISQLKPLKLRFSAEEAVSHALLVTKFFLSVETASTLLYAQETTTAQLRSHSCFPI